MKKPRLTAETFVVLAVAALVLHRVSAVNAHQREIECRRELAGLATALEHYCLDHGGQYPARLTALVPHYCAAPVVPGEAISYTTATGPEAYTIVCLGRHPSPVCWYSAGGCTLGDR